MGLALRGLLGVVRALGRAAAGCGMMVPTVVEKCDLCDCGLVFESASGQRVVFTAHTPAFCADGVRLLLEIYRKVIASNAKYAAEREWSLRAENNRLRDYVRACDECCQRVRP